MTKYRYPHCKRIVENGRVVDLSIHAVKIVMDLYGRDATKRWLKSYCEKSGKDVRLQRVGDREEDGDGGKMEDVT